jgi:tricorn protease-like protein
LLRYLFALACFGVLACFVPCGFAQTSPPLLLRNPSLSADKIAFLYADDVWTVSRQGGEARRLTSVNGRPLCFSRRNPHRLLDP